MDDPNRLATKLHLVCSACKSPVVVDGFHWRLHFPTDDELIESSLRGTLNTSACQVCGRRAGVRAPFLAIHEETKQLLLVEGAGVLAQALRDEHGRSLAEQFAGQRLTLCTDYDALRHALLPWVMDHVQDLALLTLTGDIVRVSATERLEIATRLRLRLLRLVAERVLTVALHLPEKVAQRICEQMGERELPRALDKLWPRQLAGLVIALLHDEFAAALESGVPAQFDSRSVARLAPPLIDDLVLQGCLDGLQNLAAVAHSGDEFVAAYRAHYINAVAHHIASRRNPAGAPWAGFLRFAFHASRQGRFDDAWLPGRDKAARLVRFEDLWNHCAPGLRDDPEMALDEAHALMERLGHADRLRDLLASRPMRPMLGTGAEAAEKGRKLREAMFESVTKRFVFPLDAGAREAFGPVTAGLVDTLVRGGLPDEAGQLAQALVQLALDAKDYVAAYGVGVELVKQLARAELFAHAVEVLEPLMKRFSSKEVVAQLGKAGAELTVSFWNEAGNVLRQLRHADEALGAYDLARKFLDLVEPQQRDHLEHTIWANEARVFRDQGRYAAARARFEQVLQRAPGDLLALHSLSLLHLLLSENDQALACVDRALRDPVLALDPLRHARLLQARAMALAGAGDVLAALQELARALDMAPAESAALITQICVAIALVPGAHAPHPALDRAKARLHAVLSGEVDHVASGLQHSLLATALVGLGELLIAQAADAELRAFAAEQLDPFLEVKRDAGMAWQLLALRARVALRLESDAAAWPWFERALERLDADSPVAQEAAAVLGWMRDKQRFQRELADSAIRLARAGTISAQALLPVFEFTTARSTAAKLGEDSVFATAARVPQSLTDAAAGRPGSVHVFAFLEGHDQVQGFVMRSGQAAPQLVAGAGFAAAALRALQSRFADALGFANPEDLAGLDADLGDWAAFARTLGPLLVQGAAPQDTIALLPCPSLSGLPLHLCPIDAAGTPLAEQHAVLYSGNFGMLLNRPPQPATNGGSRVLVVAVPKAGDREAFGAALGAAASAIAAGAGATSRVLAGAEATLEAIRAELQRCDAAYFLCHGTYGGRLAGFALCISDGAVLPPSLLGIDQAPTLKRFTLDWTDLEVLERAPALLVSIACSSGRTLLDAGGSRLGIEQALLAKGTRSIISPLWDVDQDAALAWLRAFDPGAGAASAPPLPIAQRCRAAAAAVRQRSRHWYFWGAFALTGALLDTSATIDHGEPHDSPS